MSERVTFLASFPPIGSAIKVSGNGDGMRVQLDVPESEMANAVPVLAWREKRLRVTVELLEDDGGGNRSVGRRSAKRRE